jgi:LPS export ABC transporter permease LptF
MMALSFKGPSTIDRYILKEMIPYFLVGFCFFDLLFIIAKLLDLMDLLIVKHAEFGLVAQLFITILPSIFAITIPLGVLVSVLLVFGRMSSDSEVIAMLSSGVSYWRMIRVPLVTGLAASVFMVVFNDTALPAGNYAFRKAYKEIYVKRPFSQLQEHRFVKIENRVFGIDRIDDKNNLLYNIIIYENDPTTGTRIVTTAEKGSWLKNVKMRDKRGVVYQVMRLQLEKGSVQNYEGKENREFHMRSFATLVITLKMRVTEDVDVERSPRDVPLKQLQSWIKRERQRENRTYMNILLVEYNKKWSIPFSSLAFIILGMGLALLPKKTGIGYGLGMSLGIMFVYYLLLTAGETLGRTGRLLPFVAIWLPNVILAAAGSVLLWRISK